MERKKVNSKLLLITLTLVLIALFLLNYFFSEKRAEGFWDYNNLESANIIRHLGNKVTDREIYYTLEEIVNQYLDSYIEKDEEKMNYMDYYNSLTDSYKKYLGRKKYKEAAENLLNKFYININSDYISMYKNKVLKKAYAFDNNIYLCELSRNNEEAYIAFQLDEGQTAFKIAYVE